MRAAVRLLALDVDGTLLRDDGTIAPVDREAIDRAVAAGVVVTLATGRLTSSALPYARELSISAPLVCADGAALFCPVTRRPLALTPLPADALGALLATAREMRLSPFLFTHGAVHGTAADVARFPWIAGWTPDLVPCPSLEPLVSSGQIITAIGVGYEAPVHAAEETFRASTGAQEEVSVFPIRSTPHWVLRLTPRSSSKALGLAQVSGAMGITAAQVAVVGDWYNDVSMLEWAGFSFAMGQAPADVKSSARWSLAATAAAGGGIAEALARLREGG